MNGLIWVAVVGIAGWLTGKLIGGRGYGAGMTGNATDWLDIVLGVTGATITGYLLSAAVIGQGSLLVKYGSGVIGSIALVWAARWIATQYLPSKVR